MVAPFWLLHSHFPERLNIDLEPGTIRLVEEHSLRTGESPEAAMQEALRERLAHLPTPEEEAERRAEIYALTRDLRARFKAHPEMNTDIDALLYDENGLPN